MNHKKHYRESKKPDIKSTHCMISFIWSFRVEKTNLWWKKPIAGTSGGNQERGLAKNTEKL